MFRVGGTTAILTATVLAACADAPEQATPAPPMAQREIDRIRDNTKHRGYWFGNSVDGMKVRSVSRSGAGITFGYGTPSCDDSGCSDELEIRTRSERINDFYDYGLESWPQADPCWRRVGRAIALGLTGCDGPSFIVYTGRLEITISAGEGEGHFDSLKPANHRTPDAPEPPARLSCRIVRRVHPHVRDQMPEELRPLRCRGVAYGNDAN